MSSSKKEFLFLECEGSTGQSAHSRNRLKNRHAQLGNASNKRPDNVSNAGTYSAPLPVQIKFKASEASKEPQTYFGRCSRCWKRRKLVQLTSRCTQCDKDDPPKLWDSGREQTTELVKHGKGYPPTSQNHSLLPAITCDISCGMQGCPADQKAMHYFLNFAALDLSGYLPGRFWDGFILQASQAEPMVRQAILAVSNVHLDHCSMVPTSATSLASYQVTVNKLRAYMRRTSDPSPELVLICCVLLFAFDRLRGETAAAAIHLQSAMVILSNARKKSEGQQQRKITAGHSQDAFNDLTNMLVQLDIEDTMPALDRGPLLDIGLDAAEIYMYEPMPMKFFSPHDFVQPWMRICHAIWSFIGRNANYRHLPIADVPKPIITYRDGLQRWVKAWRGAYKEYVLKVGIPDAASLPSTPLSEALNRRIIGAINALIIESHYYVLKSVLAECLTDTSPTRPWDLIAEKMLQCGEKALSLRQAYRKMHSLPARKTFSTHVGIAESLLCLSHRTTSPHVRSRAQELIRGFRDVSGNLTGVTAFFAGYGAPPKDLVLMYEKPGH